MSTRRLQVIYAVGLLATCAAIGAALVLVP